MTKTVWTIGLAAALLLSACTERDIVLPGPREDVRPGAAIATENSVQPISLAAQSANGSWAQGHGSPAFRVDHAALGSTPALAWSANIGKGDSRKSRITADPVVADGRIFTMDSGAQVMAHSTGGEQLWARDLAPSRDGGDDATGGGLAYDGGRVYVSSGFGLLTALDAQSGAVVWQQKLGATASGTPTVAGELVYLVAGDDTAWALEKDSGRIRWQLGAAPDVANVLGGAAPAITDQFVIFAYGGGDLQAAFRKGGLRMWDTAISGQRRFRASAKVSDITGDPVIADGRMYVSTHSGRTVALNPANGERIWTATEGSTGPVWPAGESVFLVNDRSELVRLNAEDGSRIWAVDLPIFTKSRPKRQVAIYAHNGPILAGGRIIVASDDGLLRFFDPTSGALVHQAQVPGGATTAPVVAGRTLYVVGAKGQLHAFR